MKTGNFLEALFHNRNINNKVYHRLFHGVVTWVGDHDVSTVHC